jgi:hypothetical protein
MKNMVKIMLRFRLDLAELIETNRKCSSAKVRIFRLRSDQKQPKAG